MTRTAGGVTTSTARVLGASLAGTAVEFYDFYVYGTAAALVFGPLFFPEVSPSAQLLNSYATFAVAFFARPLGAAFFGHFGDRHGRKSTLIACLMTMGVSTLAIAFLPTYATAGWLAPFLLCVMRFGQGFGLGGEWGGAALLAVENAPKGYLARFGTFPQLGAPVGFFAANGLFLLLGFFLEPSDFRDWGWRLPFLASAILVILGLWVRLSVAETPEFAKQIAQSPPLRVPLKSLFRHYPREVIGGTFAVVACFATFYLTTAFALGYGVGVLNYSRDSFLGLELGATPAMAAGTAFAGWWADKSTPRSVLMIGCVATIVAGFLMPLMLGAGSPLLIWAYLSLALFVMGLVYGPLGAFLPQLFPVRVRYTGVSLAFNIGGILGGGLAPFIAQTLAIRGGLAPVGLYLSAAAIVSLIALWPLQRDESAIVFERNRV
jgi:MFS family permease